MKFEKSSGRSLAVGAAIVVAVWAAWLVGSRWAAGPGSPPPAAGPAAGQTPTVTLEAILRAARTPGGTPTPAGTPLAEAAPEESAAPPPDEASLEPLPADYRARGEVRLHERPAGAAAILGRAPAGTIFWVVDRSGDWLLVRSQRGRPDAWLRSEEVERVTPRPR